MKSLRFDVKVAIFSLSAIALFVIILPLYLNLRKPPPKCPVVASATLVLGAENRGNRKRGWSDIIFLYIVKSNYVDIVSFPRDTLVEVPNKGWWIINSLYLHLGAEGMCKWFREEFDIPVTQYIVVNMKGIRKIVDVVGMMPFLSKETRQLIDDYEYMEDWVRHRHKLKAEVSRVRRYQAFIRYIEEKAKSEKLNGMITFVDMLDKVSKNNIEQLNFWGLYYIFKDAPINYYIWQGKHELAEFDYKFFKGKKHVYVLDHYDYSLLSRYTNSLNPYVYSTNRFIERKPGVREQFRIEGEVSRRYNKWAGYFSF